MLGTWNSNATTKFVHIKLPEHTSARFSGVNIPIPKSKALSMRVKPIAKEKLDFAATRLRLIGFFLSFFSRRPERAATCYFAKVASTIRIMNKFRDSAQVIANGLSVRLEPDYSLGGSFLTFSGSSSSSSWCLCWVL